MDDRKHWKEPPLKVSENLLAEAEKRAEQSGGNQFDIFSALHQEWMCHNNPGYREWLGLGKVKRTGAV